LRGFDLGPSAGSIDLVYLGGVLFRVSGRDHADFPTLLALFAPAAARSHDDDALLNNGRWWAPKRRIGLNGRTCGLVRGIECRVCPRGWLLRPYAGLAMGLLAAV